MMWRKSSFSEASGNSDCVEVAWAPDVAAVRDSKNPAGGMLTVPGSAWQSFLQLSAQSHQKRHTAASMSPLA
jgi:hypothetical protein